MKNPNGYNLKQQNNKRLYSFYNYNYQIHQSYLKLTRIPILFRWCNASKPKMDDVQLIQASTYKKTRIKMIDTKY